MASSISPETLLELETPAQIVVIGCGEADLIPFYTKETNCPFPIYADPTRKLYDLLGMTRTLKLGNKTPSYIQTSFISTTMRSIVQELRSGRKFLKGGDMTQVGGEFVFENGLVTWCHRMRNTRDHAEISELGAALGLEGDRQLIQRRRSSGLGRALSNRRASWSRSRSRTKEGNGASPAMTRVPEERRQEGKAVD